ncbi:MAG: TIGR02449 family protein [Pseudomonadales bacterium]|nr:TIGR02449 family protein [Pseudomonadales bacterium]
MTDSDFKNLETKVDALIQLCADMKKENQMLREHEHHWKSERSHLLSKNDLARTRLEKMLQHLKTLQQE